MGVGGGGDGGGVVVVVVENVPLPGDNFLFCNVPIIIPFPTPTPASVNFRGFF